MSSPPSTRDYTVAWLTPLYFEAGAALAMFDEYHGVPNRAPGQTIQYHLGRMGQHNVAIAGFPAGEVGIGVAASMAAEVRRDFPNLEIGLLVGIAAGIPSPERDIRLGDVVVAVPTGNNSGIIGYDLVNIEPEEIRPKQWQDASHPSLRSAISSLRARSTHPSSGVLGGNGFLSHLQKFQRTLFERPSARPPSRSSPRSTRQSEDSPIVHYGCILSGNAVIKSAEVRDDIAKPNNAVAIEMEAAGVMNRLPVAVIRGISDFADAEKNDEWQFYAAATAAAYAKELMLSLAPLHGANGNSLLKRTVSLIISHIPGSNSDLNSRTRISQTDLNLILDRKARHMTYKVYWRRSVVDLLKVLNLDPSLGARERLARRWNIRVGQDGDAVQNIALHRVIMDEIARNQGNAPLRLAAALSIDGQGP
jgi:nucleoside phosphorylase